MSNQKCSCLCGAVRFHVSHQNNSVGACHCSICRKWGGGPFMTIDCGNEVTIEGEDSISTFDSSEWAERAFCSQCGSHLFYRLKANQQYFIPAGLFENNESFVFDHQVFIDNKPSYYDFANKTQNMTEEEVFAAFGGTDES